MVEGYSFFQMYVAGGFFMHPILACLMIGLGIGFERFRTLRRASINTRQFLNDVKKALVEDGLRAALEFCEKTNGPVAAVFYAGLQRAPRGVEQVEKALMNSSAVETAFLEKNLIWLSLFVSLAPMLGVAGTVQGVIKAIGQASAVSPTIVAHGIAAALFTTLFGVVVAIIFKTAHNFFSNLIDKLVLDMETSSAELIDTLVEMEYHTQFPVNQIGQA
jgi:biopolymer transport protein ExbB